MLIRARFIRSHHGIGLLLAAALLAQAVFPLQFHLHHAADPATHKHDHVIDFHLLSDSLLNKHLADEDVDEIKTAQYYIVKKHADTGTYGILLVCLLTLAVMLLPIFLLSRQSTRNLLAHHVYYYFIPPLRAPPAV